MDCSAVLLETPAQAPVAPEPTLYIPTVSAVPEPEPVEASAPKPSAPSIYYIPPFLLDECNVCVNHKFLL